MNDVLRQVLQMGASGISPEETEEFGKLVEDLCGTLDVAMLLYDFKKDRIESTFANVLAKVLDLGVGITSNEELSKSIDNFVNASCKMNAKGYKAWHDSLIDAGFSSDEAMKLMISVKAPFQIDFKNNAAK